MVTQTRCSVEKTPTMNFIDFDCLLERMVHHEPEAFAEFDNGLRDIVVNWLRGFGKTEAELVSETPRVLLTLGIIVVQHHAEVQHGRVLAWLKAQTRNMTIRYWQELERKSFPLSGLSADRTLSQVSKLDGCKKTYRKVARALMVSPNWLRLRHRQIIAHKQVTTVKKVILQGAIKGL